MNLLDLTAGDARATASIADVFAMLPNKTTDPSRDQAEAYRNASDEACKTSFALLRTSAARAAFQQAARSLLCVKATRDPHDLKYPVAAFGKIRTWRTRSGAQLLASSVHALHGRASPTRLRW